MLIYELIGEASVLVLPISVPGPVIGMLLLFLTLLVKGKTTKSLESAGTALLSHLSLLFVPAGVGIMVHFNRIRSEWLPITIVLLLSTVITLVATTLIMQISDRILTQKTNG